MKCCRCLTLPVIAWEYGLTCFRRKSIILHSRMKHFNYKVGFIRTAADHYIPLPWEIETFVRM